MEPIQKLIDSRDGVLVGNGIGVETTKVNAHPHGSILLLHEEERVAICRIGFAYPSTGQELVNLLFTLGQLKRTHFVQAMFRNGSLGILEMNLVIHTTRLGLAGRLLKHIRELV